MLEFKPQSINGVSVFPDNADRLHYYYLSLVPQVAQRDGEPQLKLIKYRGQVGTGGLFNLTVNLGIEEERLQQISRTLDPRGQIKLSPVPVIDGTVSLTILDKKYEPSKSALFGDNQAVFSVELNQKDAVLLETALVQGEFAPIGIVYALDYLALRPAYSFRLYAQWDKVQKRLEEKFSFNAIFLKAEIDKIVDELVEDRIIEIELNRFVPEDEDISGGIDSRQTAFHELQDMILSTFFKPQFPPSRANGEAGLIFSYRQIKMTHIDQRLLNLTVNEQTTVRRSIYPQGNLQGLLSLIQKESRDRFISALDLHDPFFQRRQVQVISRAKFEADEIESITVTLQYGEQLKTVLLQSSTVTEMVEWNSLLDNGIIQREVKAKYKVRFKNVDGSERPVTLESPERVINSDYLEIAPRELYSIIPIPAIALNSTPWERYESVQVKTRYQDQANGIRLETTFWLNQSNREQIWNMFVRDVQRQTFQYQLTYKARIGQDFITPWIEDEGQILIRNPFPQQRTLEVIPLFSWSEIREVTVALSYQDPIHHIDEKQLLRFSEVDSSSQLFSANLRNPNQSLVTYRVNIFYKNGNIWDIPQSETLDKRLFLRVDMKAHRVVKLTPEAINFEIYQIQEIEVEIFHQDSRANLKTTDNFIFNSPDDYVYFEFDYADERRKHYYYRATYLFTNGFRGTTDWQEADFDKLSLKTRTIRSFLVKQIEVSAQNIDWKRVKLVDITLGYEDERGTIINEQKMEFYPGNDEPILWEVEFQNQDEQEYRWQAIATLKERRLGDKGKVYLPGLTEDDWGRERTTHFAIANYLPTDEELAQANNLFLVKLSAQGIDWNVIKRIQVTLEYGGSQKSFRLDKDKPPERLFLAPLIKGGEINSIKYHWQAIFLMQDNSISSGRKAYYPGSSSKDWEETEEKLLVLKNYAKSCSEL